MFSFPYSLKSLYLSKKHSVYHGFLFPYSLKSLYLSKKHSVYHGFLFPYSLKSLYLSKKHSVYHGFSFPYSLKNLVFLLAVFGLFTSCVTRKKPDFGWPVKRPHNLSRKHSVYHEGIDFPKGTGEPVFSIAEGRVVYAGNQLSGYGKVIIIEHDYNWASLYAHLSKILVKNGHTVRRLEKIGEVGSTGRSSSPHLHFELIYNKQPENPVPHMPKPNR